MKVIDSLDTAWTYLNRLGFAGAGTIASRQDNLKDIADLLLKASGQTQWENVRPFKVRFRPYRYKIENLNGFAETETNPWMSSFTVIRPDGASVRLSVQYGTIEPSKE
jgi:hypothetical protein